MDSSTYYENMASDAISKAIEPGTAEFMAYVCQAQVWAALCQAAAVAEQTALFSNCINEADGFFYVRTEANQ